MPANKKTSTAPPQPPHTITPATQLCFNLLPFHCRQQEAEMPFSLIPREGHYGFAPEEVPAALAEAAPQGITPRMYYTSAMAGEPGFPLMVRLDGHPALARLWCMQHLRRLLMPVVDFCRHQGPFASQFWCSTERLSAAAPALKGGTVLPNNNPACETDNLAFQADRQAFHRFTVKVLHRKSQSSPELLIGYNGTDCILNEGLYDLTGNITDLQDIPLLAFRGQIGHMEEFPETAGYHYDEVRLLLRGRSRRQLYPEGSPGPKDKTRGDSLALITAFLQTHLLNGAFATATRHKGRFRGVDAGDTGIVASAGSPLLFGEGGIASSPTEGMADHGPQQLPRGTRFACFTICLEEDQPLTGRLTGLLTTGETAKRFRSFVRVPLHFSHSHSISLGSHSMAEQQLVRRLQKLVFDTKTTWCAFLISRGHSHGLETRMAGLLLHRGVLMQKVPLRWLQGDFTSYTGLLARDLVTRLGGTPWRVEGCQMEDPVAGFAVHRPRNASGPAVGAAVLFAPGGRFAGADLFNPANPREWGGLSVELLRNWADSGTPVRRLVLHLPQPLHSHEVEALQAIIGEWRPQLQVVLMVIRRCRNRHIRVFTGNDGGSTPPDGTWVRCSDHRYLLYTRRQLRSPEEAAARVVPLTVRMILINGGGDTITQLAPALLDQLHGLIRMHRPHGVPPHLPASLTYPMLLAQKTARLPGKALPEWGKEIPWFI